MQVTFFIIDKKLEHMVTKYSSRSVAAYMLGRHCNEYIITKSDESGVRIVKFTDFDVFSIQVACENA